MPTCWPNRASTNRSAGYDPRAALSLGVDRLHVEQTAPDGQGEQVAVRTPARVPCWNGRSRSATVSLVTIALAVWPGPSIWVVSDIRRTRSWP